MFSYLERLRKKPLAVRKKIALFSAGGMTLAICLFWLATLVGEPKPQKAVREKGPFEAVGESAGALFQDIRQAAADIKAVFARSTEVRSATGAPPAVGSGIK